MQNFHSVVMKYLVESCMKWSSADLTQAVDAGLQLYNDTKQMN